MTQSAATIVPIVLAALVANCGIPDDDRGGPGGGGGGDADAGAPDSGGSAPRAGAGGSGGSKNGGSAGQSAGEGGNGDDAGDGGAGDADADDGMGGKAGGAMGGTVTGGTATGGGGVSAGAGGTTGGTDATGGCAGEGTGGSGGITPAITAVAWLEPDSCERFAAYEVRDVRDQDGVLVTDYTCEWTFSDGGVETTCSGSRTFGELPSDHHGTVVVRDSATGATTTATSETVHVIEPQAIGIYVSSYDCMQFRYDIDRQYGCGGTHSFDIQPAENIVTPGPWSMESQTIEVSAPGVYTLSYTVEGCAEHHARTCVTNDTATVRVEACP